MLRSCGGCGGNYEADPKKLERGRGKTCSRRCSYIARARARKNEVELTCDTCGAKFTRQPSHQKSKHGGNFCSRRCHYKGRSLGLVKRIVTIPYTYTEAGKARMLEASRKPKGQRIFHWLTCLQCKRVFDDPNDGRVRLSGMSFCSLECCNLHRNGENNPSWRGGHSGYYGKSWRRLRREARQRDHYTCQRCQKVMVAGKMPDVHHIQPVSTFDDPEEANFLENMISLCHPCHMHVEWHGLDFMPNVKSSGFDSAQGA